MELYAPYSSLLAEYGITDIAQVATAWREPHRHYHTEAHLQKLLHDIADLAQRGDLTQEEKEILQVTAFFHDWVYDVKAHDNEEQSAQVFMQYAEAHPNALAIRDIILATKDHLSHDRLGRIFCALDMRVVTHSSFAELLEWERQIFKEYQWIDFSMYKIGRLKLLKKFCQLYPENAQNLIALCAYVEQLRPRIGVYAGSFNPFHNGHLNIVEKAEKIFDKVIIAQGINPEKTDSKKPINLQVLRYRQLEQFQGFLTEYMTPKEKDAQVTLIRGLRNGADLDYEINQWRFMKDMKSMLDIIFIACDDQYEHISSTAIKNLESIRAGAGERYMPK